MSLRLTVVNTTEHVLTMSSGALCQAVLVDHRVPLLGAAGDRPSLGPLIRCRCRGATGITRGVPVHGSSWRALRSPAAERGRSFVISGLRRAPVRFGTGAPRRDGGRSHGRVRRAVTTGGWRDRRNDSRLVRGNMIPGWHARHTGEIDPRASGAYAISDTRSSATSSGEGWAYRERRPPSSGGRVTNAGGV